MLISLLLTCFFFLVLFFFGWQLLRWTSREDVIERLIPLSTTIGIAGYLFCTNALGYILPITVVFYLVLALFLVFGLIIFHLNQDKESLRWGIEPRWKRILMLTTLALFLLSGFISYRWPLPLNGTWMPTAATIASGNFPVVEVWQPQYPLIYHYGPELFTAAIHKVTGLPLHYAYDVQAALLIATLFMLGFSFVRRLFLRSEVAYAAALLMLMAGSLVSLNLFKGLGNVFSHFILGQHLQAPFAFISESIFSDFSIPAFQYMITQPAGALNFIFLFALLYVFYFLDSPSTRRARIGFCVLLLASLALTAEGFFAVSLASICLYPIFLFFVTKDIHRVKRLFASSLTILVLVTPVAIFQGGLLKGLVSSEKVVRSGTESSGLFRLNPEPWITYSSADGLPIYHPTFLFEWGLLLVLLAVAFRLLSKKYPEVFSLLFLATSLSFAIPFLVIYTPMPGEIRRFFLPVNLLGGLVIGCMIGWLFVLSKKGLTRVLIAVTMLFMMSQALLYQLFYGTVGYPPFVFNPGRDLYATEETAVGIAYAWVERNTFAQDRFLIVKNDYPDGDALPNHEFVINTGRMAPLYVYHWSDYELDTAGVDVGYTLVDEFDAFKRIYSTCDPDAVTDLGYSYLFVTSDWADGLEQRCLENEHIQYELAFEVQDKDDYVRIFRINNNKQ